MKCDHIKLLITLTSDYNKRISLYLLAFNVNGDIGEFELPDKHCRRLHQREPRRVEEDVIVVAALGVVGLGAVHLATLDILVQHDVEGEAECNDEEGVPDEEEEEGDHHLSKRHVCP